MTHHRLVRRLFTAAALRHALRVRAASRPVRNAETPSQPPRKVGKACQAPQKVGAGFQPAHAPARGHAHPRRGASTLELVAAMSAASVVIATSAALVHRTFSVESRSRAVVADERVALRLARQVRTDIHEAAAVAVSSGDPAIPLVAITTPGASIVYRVTDSGLLRIATSGTTEPARDSFSFSRPATWQATHEGRVITLSGSAPADATPRPVLAVEIVAAAKSAAVAAPGKEGSP